MMEIRLWRKRDYRKIGIKGTSAILGLVSFFQQTYVLLG